jgi:hypothetical protein
MLPLAAGEAEACASSQPGLHSSYGVFRVRTCLWVSQVFLG